MRIALNAVSKGKQGQALPETSLSVETGHARFVLAETELRPTVLGLIASGRMRPDTGDVRIDGAPDAGELRRRVALVDAPEVSDPHPGVALAAVVAEELMFAGLPAAPRHARRWLTQIGFGDLAGRPIGTVKPSVRVRILAELAVLRDDVEGFVLVAPDRHGGRPEGWWRIAVEFAERGFAVLVIVGGSAAAVIERMPETLEADYPSNATLPVRPLADITRTLPTAVAEGASGEGSDGDVAAPAQADEDVADPDPRDTDEPGSADPADADPPSPDPADWPTPAAPEPAPEPASGTGEAPADDEEPADGSDPDPAAGSTDETTKGADR